MLSSTHTHAHTRSHTHTHAHTHTHTHVLTHARTTHTHTRAHTHTHSHIQCINCVYVCVYTRQKNRNMNNGLNKTGQPGRSPIDSHSGENRVNRPNVNSFTDNMNCHINCYCLSRKAFHALWVVKDCMPLSPFLTKMTLSRVQVSEILRSRFRVRASQAIVARVFVRSSFMKTWVPFNFCADRITDVLVLWVVKRTMMSRADKKIWSKVHNGDAEWTEPMSRQTASPMS